MLPVTESKFIRILTYTNMSQFYTFSITKFLWTLFLWIGSGSISFGQCPTSVTILETQQDVIDFAANYGTCSTIPVRLIIREYSPNDITDLSPLSFITNVTGELELYNLALSDLSGLDNVSNVSGDLIVSNLDQITDMSDFTSLQTIGTFNLSGCDGITSITNGSLTVSNSFQLSGLSSLSNLNNFNLLGSPFISISNCPILTSINCRPANSSTFFIKGMTLSNLPALPKIDIGSSVFLFTNGSLSIQDCNALTDLLDINTSLGGSQGITVIKNNSSLTNTDRLFLSSPRIIEITDNISLSSLDLGFFNRITNSFTIHGNANLTTLNLSNLEYVEQTFLISNNASLTSLDGLDNLIAVRDLQIVNNNALIDIANLTSLENITRNLYIANNDNLTSIGGLTSLERIYEELSVLSNQNLTTIGSYPELRGVQEQITIDDNPALLDLGTMPKLGNLQSANLNIDILNNPSLTSLSGFDNLFRVSELNITDCPNVTFLFTVGSRANNSGSFFDIKIENTGIINLQGFPKINDLILWNNASLINLEWLQPNNGRVNDLWIKNCASISNLLGLEASNAMADLRLENNPLLSSLGGLQNTISADDILIFQNPALLNLNELENIPSTGQNGTPGSVQISTNNSLNSIDDFCGLFSIAQTATAGSNFFVSNNSYNPTIAEITTQGPCSSVPLPVELLKFSGIALDLGNALSWQTASEENASLFRVQTSSDGQNWKELTQITAEGESQTLQSYSYLDKLAPSGLSYYRLLLEDLDGSYEYSDVISITRIDPDQEQFAFPNPTSGLITLSGLTSSASVRILGPLGKTVLEQKLQNGRIDLSVLPPSIYTLQSEGKSFRVIRN